MPDDCVSIKRRLLGGCPIVLVSIRLGVGDAFSSRQIDHDDVLAKSKGERESNNDGQLKKKKKGADKGGR